MRTMEVDVRILFYRDSERVIAHCLEFDLIGDGENQAEAMESLSVAIDMILEDSVKHQNPRNLFNPAPGEYFEKYFSGNEVAAAKLKITANGINFHRVEAREYVAA